MKWEVNASQVFFQLRLRFLEDYLWSFKMRTLLNLRPLKTKKWMRCIFLQNVDVTLFLNRFSSLPLNHKGGLPHRCCK